MLRVLDVLEVPVLPGQDTRTEVVQHCGQTAVAAALRDVAVESVVELDCTCRLTAIDDPCELGIHPFEFVEIAVVEIGERELAGKQIERADDGIELQRVAQRLDGDAESAVRDALE